METQFLVCRIFLKQIACQNCGMIFWNLISSGLPGVFHLHALVSLRDISPYTSYGIFRAENTGDAVPRAHIHTSRYARK